MWFIPGVKLTYFGHASFLVESGDYKVLFDPFIRPNPLAAGVDIGSLKPDAILLSHGHEDHVADAVEIARASGALVVANWEVVQWLAAQGLTNVHPMNHGGARNFPFGRVKMVNAIHSSTLPGNAPGGNPAGFVVTMGGSSFYYSGDTALTMDMKLIAEEFRLDFAVLCIGDNFTMGAADAARAAVFAGATKAVGVHYDTFPPIEIVKGDAFAAFEAAGVSLLLPAIGETVEL